MENLPDTRVFSQYLFNVEKLRKNWGWFLALGILFIGLGMVSIGASIATTLLSMILLGSILLFAGIVQMIYAFWIRKWSGFFLSLLAGILYTAVGYMFVDHPAVAAISLTLLLAAFFIVGGTFRIISALTMRFEHWGWALFSGIIKLTLGILIWKAWPEAGLWIFGLFIGIDLLFYGWFWVLLALSARNTNIKPIQ